MFNKELLIMEDYVPSKTRDEYAFSHVPICTKRKVLILNVQFLSSMAPFSTIWVLWSKLRQAKSYHVFFGSSRLGALPPRKIGPL
jgi:hypothetical protein